MKWRQAKKICKKYADNFSATFAGEWSRWDARQIPHRALKQRHIKRWFEGKSEA